MSNSQWTKDPVAGRRHSHRQEENGRSTRDRSDRVGEVYSSRSGHEPRLDPFESLRSETTSRNEATSAHMSSSGRRGSVSGHRRELIGGPETRQASRPISVYKDSSRYREADLDLHRDERDEREPRSSGGFGSPTSSRSKHWEEQDPRRSGFGSLSISSRMQSSRDHPASSYHDSKFDNSEPISRDNIPHKTEDDFLEDDFDDLSIDPRSNDQEYITSSGGMSASAPAPRGKWPPSFTSTARPPAILETEPRRSFREELTNSLGRPIDAYEDIGKGVAPDVLDSQSSQPGSRHVAGTPGLVENLDSSYKVRNRDYKTFFSTGKIFSTLWTDPYAEPTNASENDQFLTRVTYVTYNERVHSKIRRFIVVQYKNRCCTCLPVTTYGGTGSQKKGISLNEHGLVYSGNIMPLNEDGINKEPLRAHLAKGSRELVNSYINYGRPYTVETNVKVKDVGDLDAASRRLLLKYYNQQNLVVDDDVLGPVPDQIRNNRGVEFSGMSGGTESYSRDYSNNTQFSATGTPAIYRSSHGNYNHIPDVSNYISQAGRDSWNHQPNRPIPDAGRGGQFNPSRDSAGNYFPQNTYTTHPSTGVGAPPPYHTQASGPMYPADRPFHYADQPQHSYPQRYDSFPQNQYSKQDYNSSFSAAPHVSNQVYRTEDSQNFPRAAHNSGSQYGSSNNRYRSDQMHEHRNPPNRSYRDSAVDDNRDIELPTLEQSKAEKERRMSVSSSGRSHGSSGRRERDQNRDRRR